MSANETYPGRVSSHSILLNSISKAFVKAMFEATTSTSTNVLTTDESDDVMVSYRIVSELILLVFFSNGFTPPSSRRNDVVSDFFRVMN